MRTQKPDQSISFQLDLNPDHKKNMVGLLNQQLAAMREAQFEGLLDRQGTGRCTTLCSEMDYVLQSIHKWLREEAKLQYDDVSRVTFAAQGGYGRGVLNPYSDIDLLILIPDNPKPIEQAFIKSFLYVLWDLQKLEIGYATHRLAEATQGIGLDLDSSTALIETRLIAGDPKPLEILRMRVAEKLQGPNRQWFIESKLAESQNRKEKYGSSIYLLEPNVKDGEGGLRDIHSIQWIAFALLGKSRLSVLVEHDIWKPYELDAVERALDFLHAVRTALHLTESRKVDVLAFDKQPLVAKALRYESDHELLAEEKLMMDYYRHARHIDRYGKKAVRVMTVRSRSAVGGMLQAMRRRSLNANYYVQSGVLFSKHSDLEFYRNRPEKVMEAFAVACSAGVIMSEELKELLEQCENVTDTDAFRESPQCRDSFMQIMGQKRFAGQTMHAMHETGILRHYMPEFRKLFCLVRIDHYHKYTVDEHLIKTLYESEELVTTGAGQRPEIIHEARSIDRWDLLNLSLLLHDIGKGEGHGHVLRGAVISQKMTQRMGLEPGEQEVVRQLILQHLKMVHISQRRDLEDPTVIQEMAGTVPDPELLRMLYILTYCDSRAVGPNTWTDWKATLLFELYKKTVLYLEGNDPIPPVNDGLLNAIAARVQKEVPSAPEVRLNAFLNNMPQKYFSSVAPERVPKHFELIQQVTDENPLVWEVTVPHGMNFTEIAVAAIAVRGLLSMICGAFASKDINILSLQVFSTKDGLALDIFQVTDLRGNRLPEGLRLDRLKGELHQVILGKRTLSEAFPIRVKGTNRTRDASAVKPVQVILNNDSSPDYTILEVKAYDRPGLLYDITRTCNEQGYCTHLAMITTEAYRVVDVFYITDLEFNKLDINQIKRLRTSLETTIAGTAPATRREHSAT